MTVTSVDDFLQAEEQAHRLVEQLDQLAQEMAHYKAAHEALDDAGANLGAFTSHLGSLTEDVGEVMEALRSIGTPEILRAQKEIARAHSQEIQNLDNALREQADQTRAALRTLRHLAAGGLALSVSAIALLAWLVLRLAGG